MKTLWCIVQFWTKPYSLHSFLLSDHISGQSSNDPVENLNEGDDAESKAEAKEASKRGNELHRAHPDAPLKL